MGKPKDVPHFPPDPQILARIKKACTTSDGLVFMDVRWWGDGGCLAVYELRPDGHTWMVRSTLRNEKTQEPRQLHLGDVNEIIEMLDAARKSHESKWYQREVEQFNLEQEAKAFRDAYAGVQIARGVAQEKKRQGKCWHGVRGDVDCPTCQEGRAIVDQQNRDRARAARASRGRVASRGRR